MLYNILVSSATGTVLVIFVQRKPRDLFTMEKFAGMMAKTLFDSMLSVRNSQIQLFLAGLDQETVGKPDGTSVSLADKASEAAGLAHLMGVAVHAEEGGVIKKGTVALQDERYAVLFDPLDGTRPFLNCAPTSTVIVALYDKVRKEVVECLVGEPISKRFWAASSSDCRVSSIFSGGAEKIVRVRDVALGSKTTVYLDLYPGFTRKGCKTLSDAEQIQLYGSIFGKISAISMLGSNGLHHALVANGGEGVAGAITTAIGGAWDVAPVLLVLRAGGAARAFSRPEDGAWIERNPLDVYSYDFLVSGNSQATVDTLSELLTAI